MTDLKKAKELNKCINCSHNDECTFCESCLEVNNLVSISKWKEQQLIEKACKWWSDIFEDRDKTIIDDFKNYMYNKKGE